MDNDSPGNSTADGSKEPKSGSKRKATDSGDEPQFVDFNFMYNYMKSIESQLFELKQENKMLNERLIYIENNLTADIAKVVKQEISSYFGNQACQQPLPASPSTSAELMEQDKTSTSEAASRKLFSDTFKSRANVIPSQHTSNQSQNNTIHENLATKPHSTIPFNHENCVILYDVSQLEKNTIEKDQIRHCINRLIGPTMIVSITRYHHETDKPKFTIQMKKRSDAEKLVKEWVIGCIGRQVKARLTKPKLLNHTGMIRNIPTDYDDALLSKDITESYPEAKVCRLHKKEKPTRTIKVEFKSETDLDHALEEGILIPSYHIRCVVEKPFTK